jgi:hypothetical protein
VNPDQLQLDFAVKALLADRLRDRQRIEGGAGKLLGQLVRQGLDERALLPAAGLVVELDRGAADGREETAA